MEGSKILTLKTFDGHEVKAPLHILNQSKFIQDMFENEDVPSEVIDLGTPLLKKESF